MRRLLLIVFLLTAAAVAQKAGPGTLLLANPKVTSGQFRHAVVLIIGAGPKGAAGLVLNRPGTEALSHVFVDVASAHARTDTAYWGGPVAPKSRFCLVVVDGKLREARLVLPGLYFSNKQDLMDLALNAQQQAMTFRVYLGYTGWNRNQLDQELKQGLWTVQTATKAEIFDADPATLWTRLTAPSKEPSVKVRTWRPKSQSQPK
ncbi:MAG: YqgE/AlgH family protein [Terriglobales bacterium]